MIVTGMNVWPIRIPYQKAYTTSRGTLTRGEGVIVEVFTDEGVTGAGEASFLFPDRSGETVETVVEVLRGRLGPLLMRKDPFDLEAINRDLDEVACEKSTFPYSRAAIDIALHDIMGKALGLPVAKLLGGVFRESMEVGRSLSIKPADEIAADAEKLRAMGYRLLTLKGSRDWKGDVERFLAVRRALGEDFPLEIDPNQSYSVKSAIGLLRRLEPCGLANLEQPCAWWDLDGMAAITRSTSVTVTADESVMSPVDVATVARMRAADMVTIKLARVGGITSARKMVAVAEASGLACNMGSKHTFGVGTAAILHFCAAHSHVTEPLGYGSPLERFTDDVILEEIPFANGVATLPEGPGLGVRVDAAKLRAYSEGRVLTVRA